MPSVWFKFLRYAPCTGLVPGKYYVSPGTVVLAVAYNGILMPRGQAQPTNSYTATGSVIALNFQTQLGDRIDAFTFG
jgi:hypothetical protein